MSQQPVWSKGNFSLFRRHLEVSGTQVATASQIKQAAKDILTFQDSGRWGIGDLAVYAKGIGKENAVDEVVETMMRDPQAARKSFYVSKDIGREDRTFELWWTFYFAVYTFPAEVRNRLLALAEENHWTLDEFKSHLRSLRHNIKTEMQSFPEGQYGLIYVDPPWEYEHTKTDSREVENHYPTLSLDAIKAFADPDGRTVEDLAGKDCILYMWATAPKTGEAMDVMAAWGFEYRSSMVWVKDIPGMGYWSRVRHELLLIGVKGNAIPPAEDVRPDSVIEAPRSSEHSKKPEVVYGMLETLYPKYPRIEIFARSTRPGWQSWGNQTPEVPADALPAADAEGEPDTEAEATARAKDAKKRSNAPRLVKGKKPGDAGHVAAAS